jgi:hypothetical protein
MKTKFLLFFLLLVAATQLKANNMLVKNVTTTGDNAANKTIQVQFDMSWDNSWRDAINWDAAWVFMKFKDASGNWQHVLLNTTGFANGTGTANTIQVGSDKVGAFVCRSEAGTGTFGSTAMQLQWNYGLNGLTSVTGLEIRVFAVEMVYVPQGDFNIVERFYTIAFQGSNKGVFNTLGNNFPVINTRLTPTLNYGTSIYKYPLGDIKESANIRIKGDAGIDTNNDGVVDNTTYPIGYKAFYCYKYELSEQQYSDFLNTLAVSQISTLGVAGLNISLINGQYFTSTPNKACGNSNETRLFAYADWSGLRPMTILEFNKASYGPFKPRLEYLDYGNGNIYISPAGYLTNYATPTIQAAGTSYYGIMDLTAFNIEPVIKLNYFNYTNQNGNGVLGSIGVSDISNWTATDTVLFIDQANYEYRPDLYGFRYVRSAE